MKKCINRIYITCLALQAVLLWDRSVFADHTFVSFVFSSIQQTQEALRYGAIGGALNAPIFGVMGTLLSVNTGGIGTVTSGVTSDIGAQVQVNVVFPINTNADEQLAHSVLQACRTDALLAQSNPNKYQFSIKLVLVGTASVPLALHNAFIMGGENSTSQSNPPTTFVFGGQPWGSESVNDSSYTSNFSLAQVGCSVTSPAPSTGPTTIPQF